MTPAPLTRVFYTSGGSESNESAFKIARYYFKLNAQPDRFKIISRHMAYHGVSMGALSATGIAGHRAMAEPLVPGFSFIPAPYCYRCELGLTYPACELACAKVLEQRLQAEVPDTVAAFIGEPIMGAGGAIVPPPEYWPTIQEICRKYGVLLILDEVVTGFGRTGKRFALEHWNLTPDMLSLAKGISSGYVPLGATIITEEIYRDLVAHGISDLAAPMADVDIPQPREAVDELAPLDILHVDPVPLHQDLGAFLGVGLEGRGRMQDVPQIIAVPFARSRACNLAHRCSLPCAQPSHAHGSRAGRGSQQISLRL